MHRSTGPKLVLSLSHEVVDISPLKLRTNNPSPKDKADFIEGLQTTANHPAGTEVTEHILVLFFEKCSNF